MQQLHRHRIQHFVADDHALQIVGQRIDPLHSGAESLQTLALAFAQRAGKVDDGVALNLVAERIEQLLGERTRAGTELPDVGRGTGSQGLSDLPRQRLGEQRRQLRGSHEVAARTRQHSELPAAT